MTHWLTLSRAARLIGVPRAELQRQIREGRLAANDGLVSTDALLALYPEFSPESSGAFERVARVREEAFGRRVLERVLPGREALVQRLYAHSQELADARRHLARYHALVVALGERLDAIGAAAPAPAWRELRTFLDRGLAEVLATEAADALVVMDDLLRIVSARVKVRPGGREFVVEGRDTLLQAALKAGLRLNYGCGNGTCGLCKARVVAGEVVKVTHCDYPMSEAERQQGHVLLCAHSAASETVEIEALEAGGPREIAEQEIVVRVHAVQPLGPDTMLLHLQTPRSSRLRFLAGQGIAVIVGEEPDDHPRVWPIASCPCDDRNLHLHLARDPGDPLAEKVYAGAVRAGTALTIAGPVGDFVLADGDRPLAFLACGTGFAPVKSLIEHAQSLETGAPISLDWVALTPDGHYLANQCRAWAAAFDDFRYAAHVAADPADGARAAVRALAGVPAFAERDCYVAGPAPFVAAALAALAAAGAPAERTFATVVGA